MANVLIIGATSVVGQRVTERLLQNTDDYLTLMARNTNMLSIDSNRGRLVHGDVLDDKPLNQALDGNEVVLVTADSNLGLSVQRIIDAMKKRQMNRLIFVTSMGLYNEIPVTDGASGNLTQDALLQPYQTAVNMIENSNFNYTIIRPAEFDQGQDINYDLVNGALTSDTVSIDSVADCVAKLVIDKHLDSKKNLAICRK
ncbi:NAD-dependent epimerase/dehydratase family protein [Companilactobacillus suantsaicola]|uniref:NAD-dependent epimerase/dehydratase family protein n=1 Tax=Companilactobacillus suantsaicola TaxID=2487723 RepID=A0A4Z0JNM4_9LACO|nr:NAD(P)H-binding protein [Companilactobacillus suantsaicola]TGD23999.1 NAD-dependent epimerase/dehydratase family protein [Companilactobacillus suantsaicola]